ncbi:hypothetical protein HDU81_001056 [Chytriomyces hyalinus]|nr:hypothetical protein HDU81_001056 [Chytriomyces hyalinus]
MNLQVLPHAFDKENASSTPMAAKVGGAKGLLQHKAGNGPATVKGTATKRLAALALKDKTNTPSQAQKASVVKANMNVFSHVKPVLDLSSFKNESVQSKPNFVPPTASKITPPIQRRRVQRQSSILPSNPSQSMKNTPVEVVSVTAQVEESCQPSLEDMVQDIEYAPMHDVVALGFRDDDCEEVDLKAFLAPTWEDLYPNRRPAVDLDELSDVTDPLSCFPELESFDISLPDDPFASLDPIDSFLF